MISNVRAQNFDKKDGNRHDFILALSWNDKCCATNGNLIICWNGYYMTHNAAYNMKHFQLIYQHRMNSSERIALEMETDKCPSLLNDIDLVFGGSFTFRFYFTTFKNLDQ